MLALQAIERDVRMAGYGMTVNILGATYMPCSTVNVYQSGAATTVPVVPVSITDGGTGSDTITVMYATSRACSHARDAGGIDRQLQCEPWRSATPRSIPPAPRIRPSARSSRATT